MQRRGLVFLLLSGCVFVCHLQTDGFIRHFRAVNLSMTWTDAQSYCRHNFIDLATIQNPANNSEALQVAGSGQFWIGLSFNRNWSWSQDDQVLTGFTSWASGEPRGRDCVTISGLGNWTVTNCSAQYYGMCYSAVYNKHILVNQMMNRSEAQTYCRSQYTDLSSIRTLNDIEEMSSLLQHHYYYYYDYTEGGVDSAWINGEDCAMMESAGWSSQPCSDKHTFLCEAVRVSAMKLVKVRLSGGSADPNDLALQDGILQQLKQKLKDGRITEDVKLLWRNQPDGKIFHREEESAPPGDCDG